jgi:hypothetical protein
MMVWECMSTCYVLFCVVVVPASDPKDMFMECVTMCYRGKHRAGMGRLS